ncbi:DUF3885 domain-containing protein [Paenibacillus sp. FSL K6-1330]|uniref:DUF3885 domain-containing protein n=1 Tax=Paenibacillus sp. FSL K6-1330 TaxID=2975292 RepID=UPI0030DB09B4
MKTELIKFINEHFHELWMDINVRFELGEPYQNGSEERINQVNYRVNSIFDFIFNKDEEIYLFIKDPQIENDIMFGNTTPNYLYELLNDFDLEEDKYIEYDEDYDEAGNTIQITREFLVKILYSRVRYIPYREILSGIANYEQGREPSIVQSIYFVSISKGIVFYMYDDRGCIAYSNSKEKLKPLYTKNNEWIVNYWREYIDSIFKEV